MSIDQHQIPFQGGRAFQRLPVGSQKKCFFSQDLCGFQLICHGIPHPPGLTGGTSQPGGHMRRRGRSVAVKVFSHQFLNRFFWGNRRTWLGGCFHPAFQRGKCGVDSISSAEDHQAQKGTGAQQKGYRCAPTVCRPGSPYMEGRFHSSCFSGGSRGHIHRARV